MRGDQQRVRSLLSEAITILCKNTLSYNSEFCVEGLLGITLDRNEVFLVNINENVQGKEDAGNSSNGATVMPPQLEVIHQQITQPSPMRPVPTSRPIPAKSPFFPRRTAFGQRSRWRARGKHPVRPPSRLPAGSPPVKRVAVDVPPTQETAVPELIEVTDEELQKDLESNVTMVTDSVDTDNVSSDNPPADPLSSLDFGDMVSQYKDSASSQQPADSEDTIPQDEEVNNSNPVTEEGDENDAIIIKPDPETVQDVSRTSADSGLVFGSSIDHSAGLLPPTPAGHSLISSGAIGIATANPFVNPAIPGFSGWSPSVSATSSPSLATPGRSGPGRPIAPASSSSQGSSQAHPQHLLWICTYCKAEFGYRRSLIRHVKSTHEGSRAFRCKICNRQTRYKCNLKQHIERCHPRIDAEACCEELK